MLTAQDIYDNYPSSDLLGCGPPENWESDEEYADRAAAEAGDTLYVFFLRELLSGDYDEVSLLEARLRLDRAMKDIEAMQAMIEDKQPSVKTT